MPDLSNIINVKRQLGRRLACLDASERHQLKHLDGGEVKQIRRGEDTFVVTFASPNPEGSDPKSNSYVLEVQSPPPRVKDYIFQLLLSLDEQLEVELSVHYEQGALRMLHSRRGDKINRAIVRSPALLGRTTSTCGKYPHRPFNTLRPAKVSPHVDAALDECRQMLDEYQLNSNADTEYNGEKLGPGDSLRLRIEEQYRSTVQECGVKDDLVEGALSLFAQPLHPHLSDGYPEEQRNQIEEDESLESLMGVLMTMADILPFKDGKLIAFNPPPLNPEYVSSQILSSTSGGPMPITGLTPVADQMLRESRRTDNKTHQHSLITTYFEKYVSRGEPACSDPAVANPKNEILKRGKAVRYTYAVGPASQLMDKVLFSPFEKAMIGSIAEKGSVLGVPITASLGDQVMGRLDLDSPHDWVYALDKKKNEAHESLISCIALMLALSTFYNAAARKNDLVFRGMLYNIWHSMATPRVQYGDNIATARIGVLVSGKGHTRLGTGIRNLNDNWHLHAKMLNRYHTLPVHYSPHYRRLEDTEIFATETIRENILHLRAHSLRFCKTAVEGGDDKLLVAPSDDLLRTQLLRCIEIHSAEEMRPMTYDVERFTGKPDHMGMIVGGADFCKTKFALWMGDRVAYTRSLDRVLPKILYSKKDETCATKCEVISKLMEQTAGNPACFDILSSLYDIMYKHMQLEEGKLGTAADDEEHRESMATIGERRMLAPDALYLMQKNINYAVINHHVMLNDAMFRFTGTSFYTVMDQNVDPPPPLTDEERTLYAGVVEQLLDMGVPTADLTTILDNQNSMRGSLTVPAVKQLFNPGSERPQNRAITQAAKSRMLAERVELLRKDILDNDLPRYTPQESMLTLGRQRQERSKRRAADIMSKSSEFHDATMINTATKTREALIAAKKDGLRFYHNQPFVEFGCGNIFSRSKLGIIAFASPSVLHCVDPMAPAGAVMRYNNTTVYYHRERHTDFLEKQGSKIAGYGIMSDISVGGASGQANVTASNEANREVLRFAKKHGCPVVVKQFLKLSENLRPVFTFAAHNTEYYATSDQIASADDHALESMCSAMVAFGNMRQKFYFHDVTPPTLRHPTWENFGEFKIEVMRCEVNRSLASPETMERTVIHLRPLIPQAADDEAAVDDMLELFKLNLPLTSGETETPISGSLTAQSRDTEGEIDISRFTAKLEYLRRHRRDYQLTVTDHDVDIAYTRLPDRGTWKKPRLPKERKSVTFGT